MKQKDGESISPVTITSDQKPIVNLNTLLENLDNDHKALESVLYQFDNGALQLMASIVQHTNSNDAKAIIMPAHSLKGQAMHVEMHEVITLANTIETLALENKSTEIKPFVPLLQQALNQGLLALNQAIVNLKKEKAA